MKNRNISLSILTSLAVSFLSTAAMADVTSPSIKDKGKKYTTEKPLTNYYGTGSSARLVEASELRIAVEDMLTSGDFEKAIPKAKKAVQLDPGDPQGHVYLAKALTMKFYQSKGEIDEKLLAECIREWQLIRYHDADPTEQWEAGNEAKKLTKIAKALEKEKKAKERQRADEELAKKEVNGEVKSKVADKKVPSQDAAETSESAEAPVKKAEKVAEKKRFRFF
ncbi:MAG: hypothetical protein K2X27_20910 [Candidatus Obscuribacterales bacterium]|nr:hypothetical protein [Candidatus Obscuribacterales bacterium]